MKQSLKVLKPAIIAALVIYALVSFTLMQPNPAVWSENARGMMCAVVLIIGAASYINEKTQL